MLEAKRFALRLGHLLVPLLGYVIRKQTNAQFDKNAQSRANVVIKKQQDCPKNKAD